jgi:hypothetical protein
MAQGHNEQAWSKSEVVKSKTNQEGQFLGQTFQKPDWHCEKLKWIFKDQIGVVKNRIGVG